MTTVSSGQTIDGSTLPSKTIPFIGGSAKKNPATPGGFDRLHDFVLRNLVVDPGHPVTTDPEFTSVVNGLIEDCTFQNWLDAYYDAPTAPGAVNHHIECFQIGGCQGLTIRRCHFLNGEIHALFCRAWSASASVPGQAVQGLILEESVFGATRHGFNCVDILDDLADPALGPSSVSVLGCAFGQWLSMRVTKGVVEIAYNHFPAVTQYGLSLWKAAGYNVHDNVYQSIDKGVSPFPGDKVDPNVDLTTAPGVPGSTPPVVPPIVTPPVDPPPVVPPVEPPPVVTPPPTTDPGENQIALLTAELATARADLATAQADLQVEVNALTAAQAAVQTATDALAAEKKTTSDLLSRIVEAKLALG